MVARKQSSKIWSSPGQSGYNRPYAESPVQVTNLNKTPITIQANEVIGELNPVIVRNQGHVATQQTDKEWHTTVTKMIGKIPPEVSIENKLRLVAL